MFFVESDPVLALVICFHISDDKVTEFHLYVDIVILFLLHLLLEDVDEVQTIFRLIREGVKGFIVSKDFFNIGYSLSFGLSEFKDVQFRCKSWYLYQELDNRVSLVIVLDFNATVHDELGEVFVHQKHTISHKLEEVMKRSNKASFFTLSCD